MSLGINGLLATNNFNSNTSNQIKKMKQKGDFAEMLSKTTQSSKHNKVQDKKLMATCNEMESIFIAKMFKEMRKNLHKNDMLGGDGFAQGIFEDMLYDEYSKQAANNNKIGIAEMLYSQLSQKAHR